MPRKYVPDPLARKYKHYDEEVIKQAVKELFVDASSTLASVAKKYNINKSVLHRHSKKSMKKPGGQNVLTDEIELSIIDYLNICSGWGYPLDIYEIRVMIKMYLDEHGIQNRFKNNMPGVDFMNRFLKRRKDVLCPKIGQNIKNRSCRLTLDVVKSYFSELTTAFEDVSLENVMSYEEINLADDAAIEIVTLKRQAKYPERIGNHPKSIVSVMFSTTATGEFLPPYVVYNESNINETWTKHGPDGAQYNRTVFGWFDAVAFEDYFKSIILPFFKNKSGKKIIIANHLSSHLSIEVIRICIEENISFVFVPVNSSHLTHPLEVAFDSLVEASWKNILLEWKDNEGKNQSTVPKECFPKLLAELVFRISEKAKIDVISGFTRAGITPINCNEVLIRLPNIELLQSDDDNFNDVEIDDKEIYENEMKSDISVVDYNVYEDNVSQAVATII